MTKSKDEEALEIEAAIDDLELREETEDETDILLEVKGNLTYPLFSKWVDREIAGVTIKGNERDSNMSVIIHAKDDGPELTLRAFGGSCDDIRIPSIMKDYILYREWYSRLDTEPCVDLLVYNDEKAEFALILVDMEYQMLLFPGFIWAAPKELVEDWLAKRGEDAYRTAFEFSDVAAWLDHEITNKELQPGLFLNYKEGPSICISGSDTEKVEEITLETRYTKGKVKESLKKVLREKGE